MIVKATFVQKSEIRHEAPGIPEIVAGKRGGCCVVPVDDDIIKIQQSVADRFARFGLIPKQVTVADIVWKWTPGS